MDVLWVLAALSIGAPAEEKFERHADIAYRTDKDADKERHLLDVYVPKGKKDFPVVLFVHGGTWRSGNKNLYGALGQSLATDGIGCVIWTRPMCLTHGRPDFFSTRRRAPCSAVTC